MKRIILAAVAACTLAGAAYAGPAVPTVPTVPTDLVVPDGNNAFLVGHAVGVQIYACTGNAWELVGPEAKLYGDNGKLVATHFTGPTWQAKDGSSVVGSVVKKVSVDPTAIPWLKLSAASTATGADGDRLVHTTFVQRLDTTGGLAPAASSCAPSIVGARTAVPYTADYVFWKAAA